MSSSDIGCLSWIFAPCFSIGLGLLTNMGYGFISFPFMILIVFFALAWLTDTKK